MEDLTPITDCLTQSLSDSYETPSSLAISQPDLPLERTSSTASRRNSGGYGARYGILEMDTDPSGQVGHCRPSAQVSTKAGPFQSTEAGPLHLTPVAALRLAPIHRNLTGECAVVRRFRTLKRLAPWQFANNRILVRLSC